MTPFLVSNTPLEDHLDRHGLLVKREDLSCPPPGPPFSKTRGVLAHVRARYTEGVRLFGVLDTFHSQAGHAVAAAVDWINRTEAPAGEEAAVLNFYPVYKAELTNSNGAGHVLREPQMRSKSLGAGMRPLDAGRSAILFHQARKLTEAQGGYMMPNALKLPEMVDETAAEVRRTLFNGLDAQRLGFQAVAMPWIIACSSGTIAAGVIKGLDGCCEEMPTVILHMGYDRSEEELLRYVLDKSGVNPLQDGRLRLDGKLRIVNEHYAYKDKSKVIHDLPFPANHYYDMKAVNWWLREGRAEYHRAVLWLIG